ncbi:hypothetical protein M422DRAFT_262758 [Sphaerobolus stellatus SS14]|uniref:Uncharacterized protein n=1 Tax=Sphaerobolus stellatus (strain SS14) TaxID=990650 RepID=A0A0C9VBY3_SPHS4|nr:hypothetical protein M422DRAFT_262758 [Sphaerobolus stellatus SS14]
MEQSADSGRLSLSANCMYCFTPSNIPSPTNLLPEDLDLIRLWYAMCSNETMCVFYHMVHSILLILIICGFTLGASTITNPPPTTLLSTTLRSFTRNKAAHCVLELWNKFAGAISEPQNNNISSDMKEKSKDKKAGEQKIVQEKDSNL